MGIYRTDPIPRAAERDHSKVINPPFMIIYFIYLFIRL